MSLKFEIIKNNPQSLLKYIKRKEFLYDFLIFKNNFIKLNKLLDDKGVLTYLTFRYVMESDETKEQIKKCLQEMKIISNLKGDESQLEFTLNNETYTISDIIQYIKFKDDLTAEEKRKIFNKMFPNGFCYDNSKNFINAYKNVDRNILFGIFSPYNNNTGFSHFVIISQNKIIDPTFNIIMDKEKYVKLFNFEIIEKYSLNELENIENQFLNECKTIAKDKNKNIEITKKNVYKIFNFMHYLVARNNEELKDKLLKDSITSSKLRNYRKKYK